jgi:hypothetical protein
VINHAVIPLIRRCTHVAPVNTQNSIKQLAY